MSELLFLLAIVKPHFYSMSGFHSENGMELSCISNCILVRSILRKPEPDTDQLLARCERSCSLLLYLPAAVEIFFDCWCSHAGKGAALCCCVGLLALLG